MDKAHNGTIVTMKDIALKTGYSINTVSRALKDKLDISEETKSLIHQTAKELGYIGNSVASSLRSGQTGTIAIIISDISNPLFGIMVKDIEKELKKISYCAFVLNTDENTESEDIAIRLALRKKVDGIIICPTQVNKENVRLLMSSGIPFVLTGRRFNDLDTDYVIWDDEQGAYFATSYLIDQGHRDILFLNGPNFISSAQERLNGFKKALKEHGLEFSPKYVREIKMTPLGVNYEIKKVLKAGIRFTAIFAFSDWIAWEVITSLNELGYKVPEDIIVVGFDNIQSRFRMSYPLTSVDTPKRKMAQLVTEILMKRINKEDMPTKHYVIPTKLEKR